jgi:hypothetical protein
MNPSQPTTAQLHEIEDLFLERMTALTKQAAHRSFEYQFSDRWMRAGV